MKNRLITVLIAAGVLAACVPASAASIATLTLIPPTGVVTGAPGQTTGWGFTITNTMNYALVTSAFFCLDLTTDCFVPSPNFTDFVSGRVVVGPPPSESPVVTEMFNISTQRGVGSFMIPANAMPGDMIHGLIVLTYDLFTRSPNDPHFNPDTDLISTDNFLSADARVVVTSGIPEPATIGLTGLALAGLGFAYRRRRG